MPELEKKLIQKQLDIDIKEVDKEEGIVKFILSSGTPDRQGEMIDQTSWKLSDYLKNPVVLWSHDAYQPAIGQMISLGTNADSMLEGSVKFAVKEYDFAKTLFNLVAGKFIRAVSVGFVSETSDTVNDVKVLKDNTLYEVSLVNIPADALALAKMKGIDISTLDTLKSKGIVEPHVKVENVETKKIETEEIQETETTTSENKILSVKSRNVLQKAHDSLQDVLSADRRGDKGAIISKRNKFNKTVNQAVRELLQAKKLK